MTKDDEFLRFCRAKHQEIEEITASYDVSLAKKQITPMDINFSTLGDWVAESYPELDEFYRRLCVFNHASNLQEKFKKKTTAAEGSTVLVMGAAYRGKIQVFGPGILVNLYQGREGIPEVRLKSGLKGVLPRAWTGPTAIVAGLLENFESIFVNEGDFSAKNFYPVFAPLVCLPRESG